MQGRVNYIHILKVVNWLYYYYIQFTMNEYEISKLKKQLLRKNEVIKEMKEDLTHVEKQLVTVQAERDKYHGQLQIARQTMENVDQIIDQKVREMRAKLEHENATSLSQLQTLRSKIKEEQAINSKFNEEIRNKDAVISQLSLRLRQMSIKHKDHSMQLNIKDISEQAAITYNQFYKLTEKYNKLSQDMENILAQNKILRKLHGVPENFGFDLEEIKIAEKQELQDYKAQCRKLETQIEELEAERTQLRYRLRQYNTLYSNKGQRYKDLTQRQLQLLDIYALNLKEGRDQLPEIDKSQKQMEKQIIRLRAQVEVLQNKAPIGIFPGTKNETGGGQMSKDALKRVQDQIKSILEPFVQDIRKLSETNLNSIIQNFQTIQGDTTTINVLPGGHGQRPPIPLPIANNDWSTIKEGYSYRYACKIPVDIKDLQTDVGFDIIKAKYEIAALQLQNIESLKMLKQKQDQEKIIKDELTDLKQKFKKCLLTQDKLFVKYFEARNKFRQDSKLTEIQKRRFMNERDELRTELANLKEAYHVLATKTEVEAKMKQFGERLAKSEAGLLKSERKYQIIFDQHQYLRDSYSKMELKAANNEKNLKLKSINARKNEKQLTFLMSQILDETKDSVSSDTHNLLLAKMELLNDKTARAAFKESELRLKISRLESVEREMNIKDDIIEYLREDKLDLLLELEVVRNRLRSIDPNYRQTLAIFEKLVGFINQNSISILECFKKFDKDKSGLLSKNQFKSALDAFGFGLKNQQFQLLYGEFDLDGSGNLNYTEFMRKLKRGGANSRSEDERAIYLFFKAIKSANISIKRAFNIVDKDGSGTISKSEMETAFRKIGIQCDSKTVDAIFRIADSNMNGDINCSELEQLYYDIVRQSEIDEQEIKPSLDWKYKFILELDKATSKNKMTMEETFKALDNDGSNYMTINELSEFIRKTGAKLENHHLKELFKFLDVRFDGKVEYGEFLKVLDDAKREQKRVDRLVKVQERAEQLRKQNELVAKQMQSSKPSEEVMLKIRMEALETKQTNLIARNTNLCKLIALREQQIKDLQSNLEHNNTSFNSIQDKYSKERQINITLEEKMKKYVGEAQAKKLRQEQKKIKITNNELETELQTFKGLCATLTDKNKVELMSIAKIKAELNKHYDIVKQLQSENINKSELGRLALEIEYSKRNEEIVNKKYEDVCEQNKNLTVSNNELANESLDKEKQIVNAHLLMREKTNLMQKNIDSLTAKLLPTIESSKIDDFISKLRQISTAKSQLEEQNKSLRQKNFNLQLKYDHVQILRNELTNLQQKLRKHYSDDDSSLALIDLTKQLSDYKIGELRSKRQYNLLKEKQEYYLRINNANTDNIKELEVEMGKWENKYNQREEFWRKRMADQIKLRDELEREVTKTKQNEVKAAKYFNNKQIEEAQIEQKYEGMDQDRVKKLSQFAKPPSAYRSNQNDEEYMMQMKGQIAQLTQHLQDKEKQIYKLRTTIQQLIPEQKLRFSSIGSQIGSHIQTNSFVLQTQLTTSQLKNNARRFLNSQKDQQAFFRDEAERMAQAAQQSIDTLQRIIDDKNEQLRRKQKVIDDLKRDMLKNKEEDCYQIQKLNQELRELRSKKQINSIDQLMNKSTNRNFYPSGGNNDDRIKNLMQMIEDKDIELKNAQRKYNELFISKSKVKPGDSANNKIIENKLKQLMEQREDERKRYVQAQKALKQKVKNLQKLIREKDIKLSQLHKTITDLKQEIINEKNDIKEQGIMGNQQFIKQVIKANTGNDGKLESHLQRSIEQLQQVKKKNKELEGEVSRLKNESKMNKTMSRR